MHPNTQNGSVSPRLYRNRCGNAGSRLAWQVAPRNQPKPCPVSGCCSSPWQSFACADLALHRGRAQSTLLAEIAPASRARREQPSRRETGRRQAHCYGAEKPANLCEPGGDGPPRPVCGNALPGCAGCRERWSECPPYLPGGSRWIRRLEDISEIGGNRLRPCDRKQ